MVKRLQLTEEDPATQYVQALWANRFKSFRVNALGHDPALAVDKDLQTPTRVPGTENAFNKRQTSSEELKSLLKRWEMEGEERSQSIAGIYKPE